MPKFCAKVLCESFVRKFCAKVLGESFFFWNHILHLGLGAGQDGGAGLAWSRRPCALFSLLQNPFWHTDSQPIAGGGGWGGAAAQYAVVHACLAPPLALTPSLFTVP